MMFVLDPISSGVLIFYIVYLLPFILMGMWRSNWLKKDREGERAWLNKPPLAFFYFSSFELYALFNYGTY